MRRRDRIAQPTLTELAESLAHDEPAHDDTMNPHTMNPHNPPMDRDKIPHIPQLELTLRQASVGGSAASSAGSSGRSSTLMGPSLEKLGKTSSLDWASFQADMVIKHQSPQTSRRKSQTPRSVAASEDELLIRAGPSPSLSPRDGRLHSVSVSPLQLSPGAPSQQASGQLFTPKSAMTFKVLHRTLLRARFSKHSHMTEVLLPGQEITVVEMRASEGGIMRARCNRGWASVGTADGKLLLEEVETTVEGRSISSMDDTVARAVEPLASPSQPAVVPGPDLTTEARVWWSSQPAAVLIPVDAAAVPPEALVPVEAARTDVPPPEPEPEPTDWVVVDAAVQIAGEISAAEAQLATEISTAAAALAKSHLAEASNAEQGPEEAVAEMSADTAPQPGSPLASDLIKSVEAARDAAAVAIGGGDDEADIGSMVWRVVCPEGVAAGDWLAVDAPDGSEVEVTVPPGVQPGETFEVEFECAAAPAPAPAAVPAAVPAGAGQAGEAADAILSRLLETERNIANLFQDSAKSPGLDDDASRQLSDMVSASMQRMQNLHRELQHGAVLDSPSQQPAADKTASELEAIYTQLERNQPGASRPGPEGQQQTAAVGDGTELAALYAQLEQEQLERDWSRQSIARGGQGALDSHEIDDRSPEDMTDHHAFVAEAMELIFNGLTSKAEATMAFRRMDKDNSGQLDPYEFKMALKFLRLHISDDQAEVVVAELDKDGDGMVSITEFLDLVWQGKLERVRQKFRTASYTTGRQDWARLFRHYDRNNSGVLEFDEFRRAVRRDAKMTAAMVSDTELGDMFDSVDLDGGGTIGLPEFLTLLGAEKQRSSGAQARAGSISGQVIELILEHADTKKANLQYLLRRYDRDGSGGLEPEEFRSALRELGISITKKETRTVFREIDRSGAGFISIKSFSDRIRQAKKDMRELARAHSPPKPRAVSRQKQRRAASRSRSRGSAASPPPPTASGAYNASLDRIYADSYASLAGKMPQAQQMAATAGSGAGSGDAPNSHLEAIYNEFLDGMADKLTKGSGQPSSGGGSRDASRPQSASNARRQPTGPAQRPRSSRKPGRPARSAAGSPRAASGKPRRNVSKSKSKQQMTDLELWHAYDVGVSAAPAYPSESASFRERRTSPRSKPVVWDHCRLHAYSTTSAVHWLRSPDHHAPSAGDAMNRFQVRCLRLSSKSHRWAGD